VSVLVPWQVDVFFYGTFMASDVMAERGVSVSEVAPARVADYELNIAPRVNLVPVPGALVYGSVASVTHGDIDGLYGDLEADFGVIYRPVAVGAIDTAGHLRAALCYLAPGMTPGPADPGYVRHLAECVRSLGHPESYAQHVESFLA
jgi:hypothetical protein